MMDDFVPEKSVGQKQIALVGAVYIDTILDVPRYPEEDSKLRASSLIRRRGGNTANTAEVLAQFDGSQNDQKGTDLAPLLISVLPCDSSPDFKFIHDSLPGVVLDRCRVDREKDAAPSSYIFRSQDTGSRTIVNFNDLDDLSLSEFEVLFQDVGRRVKWWHFEGRNPNFVGKCIDYIRESGGGETPISVEVEKPGREGLGELSLKADYVFYSRSWAVSSGSSSLFEFLGKQQRYFLESPSIKTACIFCTWAEEGSGACEIRTGAEPQVVPARLPDEASVVDTVGAGDVFTAAMLVLLNESMDLSPDVLAGYLDGANRLCGRKICQEGFRNLLPLEYGPIEN